MTISLARGIPAPECLPVEELADCAQAALRRDGATILSYGSTLGYEPLREWIAERHAVEPGRVIVTNGSLQVFHFLLSALPAGPVIVERPTYDRPRKILLAEGRELIEVPVDADGLDVDELARVGPAALLYTIPTFQNPTGTTLSDERRRRLAELARDRSLTVLEDDPYSLVRFEGERLPSVLELEGGEHVLYSSSFSKTVAPGLRVGQLEGLVASTYITPALLAQATVHEFLRRGLLEPSLERVSGLLRERRDAMLEALDRELVGQARWNRPEGGYFLWLDLPEELDASELLGRAVEAGVTFVPGVDFGGPPNSMRLAFSFVSPAEIDEGVSRLARLVASAPAPA
ncbi:MAG: PLP-dependent aminotransferase family protein [Actinobacteria bacterium]|nr:MAG: PLP-dependent aminotransferase family protein [Actinomycetota bacterium]